MTGASKRGRRPALRRGLALRGGRPFAGEVRAAGHSVTAASMVAFPGAGPWLFS